MRASGDSSLCSEVAAAGRALQPIANRTIAARQPSAAARNPVDSDGASHFVRDSRLTNTRNLPTLRFDAGECAA